MNSEEIRKQFITKLEEIGKKRGFHTKLWRRGGRQRDGNILELSGVKECLVYFKVRSADPLRWGVTSNRIEELTHSGKRWLLVLLSKSANTGFVLSEEDVRRALSSWPLGKDGDYKVRPGSCLEAGSEFHGFSELVDALLGKHSARRGDRWERIQSVMGKYAFVPTSSDDFARRKQYEIAREK